MDNPIESKLKDKGYDPAVALAICEAIASGKTVTEIVATEGMPSRSTIYRWLTVYPKFFDAYERARELAAQSFEDEALDLARKLTGPNDFTGTKVQAYNVAMQQLRWSAARRDPDRYGQKTTQTSQVPIQIVTTLNLGQEGQGPVVDASTSVYTIDVSAASAEASAPDHREGRPVPDTSDDDTPLRLNDETAYDEAEATGLPFGLAEHERQQLYNPPLGRPKGRKDGPLVRRGKGHKSLAKTKMAITKAAKKASENERAIDTDGGSGAEPDSDGDE